MPIIYKVFQNLMNKRFVMFVAFVATVLIHTLFFTQWDEMTLDRKMAAPLMKSAHGNSNLINPDGKKDQQQKAPPDGEQLKFGSKHPSLVAKNSTIENTDAAESNIRKKAVVNSIHDNITRMTRNLTLAHSNSSILDLKCCKKNITIDNTNLKQIEYFWSRQFNKSDFKIENLIDYPEIKFQKIGDWDKGYEHYTHSFHLTTFKDGILLKIQEFYFSKHTEGGSGFKITFDGNQVYNFTCPFLDYHNGSYVAFCSLPYKDCGKLEVKFMFKNYSAFKSWVLHPYNKVILSQKVCVAEGYMNYLPSKSCKHVDYSSRGFWRKQNNELRWEKDGCQLPVLSKIEQKECLNQLNSVSYYGDSHLRYKLFYTLRLAGLLDAKKHGLKMRGSYDIGKMHYTFNGYARDYPKILRNLSKSDKIYTKKDIFIMDGGSWDLCFFETKNFFKTMPPVLSLLQKIVEKDNFKNATFLWVNMPAFTEEARGNRQFNHNRYNNFLKSAINEWTMTRLRSFGFQILDFFSFSHPRTNDHVCKFHYLCWDYSPKPMTGPIGLTVMQNIFDIVCR